jgi:predicted MPP superfamily phosphohydrolase
MAILSVILIVGSTINRYRTDVTEAEVVSTRLPKEFDGYRIVHFSDMHLETLYSRPFAQRVVDCINALKPDMIVYSGDMVNRKSTELDRYFDILSQLQARDGVYSVLGNHDYGDFVKWSSQEAHQANLDRLCQLQADMGWTLLNNASCHIHHNGDSIAIIGVENWGEPPFQQYGNLEEAYPDLHSDTYKLLISHNPRHWRAEVLPNSNIDLMMAGHTHALQMEVCGYSPIEAHYPEWGGLYNEGEQYLYVNIGIGCTMTPTRLGATPEITLITLKSLK